MTPREERFIAAAISGTCANPEMNLSDYEIAKRAIRIARQTENICKKEEQQMFKSFETKLPKTEESKK